MASTAPKTAADERYDGLDELDRKAQLLANHMKKSKHFVVFTGAGVSTSAEDHTLKVVNTLQAILTLTHMALVEL
ncbi:hypothetical protein B0H67DRAFT_646257 [Lasiosphaeris hirsuta]|uniref:Deacetylase sirtuin-type domain-containing protein n=1 Tax=Lasiosphaeris hirsuta TaxID=260670 RepID=A0AA40A7N2_9PEZI|nr:hypothetical protein B0H67DRAFT_646257 [Lasiosphaeris hirsuta]